MDVITIFQNTIMILLRTRSPDPNNYTCKRQRSRLLEVFAYVENRLCGLQLFGTSSEFNTLIKGAKAVTRRNSQISPPYLLVSWENLILTEYNLGLCYRGKWRGVEKSKNTCGG